MFIVYWLGKVIIYIFKFIFNVLIESQDEN